MKSTAYFKEDEFKCKCCGQLPKLCPPDGLVDILIEIREHFDKPVRINSGYRCPKHNKAVGGAPKSRHVVGDAVDISVQDVPTADVYNWVLETYGSRPLGIAKKLNKDPYKGFVHIDTRGVKARWAYSGSYEPEVRNA